MEELLYKDKLKDQDESFFRLSLMLSMGGEALRKGPAALKPYGAQRDLQYVWRIFFSCLFRKRPRANVLTAPKSGDDRMVYVICR